MNDIRQQTVQWLRHHLEARGRGTQSELAVHLGITHSAVSRMLSEGTGKEVRGISAEELLKMAEFFGEAPPLPPGLSAHESNFTAAVRGRIGAGAEISPDDEQVPPEGLYEIEVTFPVPEGAIAFEVSGESMWPRYDPGDVIMCWRWGTDVERVLGWEAAVATSDGHRYLKRVLRGAEAGTFDLESHNAPPIRNQRLVWVAEILSVVRSGQWKRLNETQRAKALRKAVHK